MKSLPRKSVIPLISSSVLLVVVILKLLGLTGATIGVLGLTAMIVLLISSFKDVFFQSADEIED